MHPFVKRLAKECILAPLHAARRAASSVPWTNLRRTKPLGHRFGLDRGQPVDRFYIEQFLGGHSCDIRGNVLEIGAATYCRRWGGERVDGVHVLHAVEGNPEATIVGDLSNGKNIPASAFDCIILTQTLPFIYDVHGAVRNCYRALRAHGVVLATLPGISQISRYDMSRWGDYWRFTSLSARMLFAEVFGEENVRVESHGNVLVAVSLLHGIAAEDLTAQELNEHDDDYEVTITIRAQKIESLGH